VTFKAAVDFFKSTNFDATVNLLKSTNFNENINMKNHQIKNVQDGVENNETVGIKQLNEFEDNLVKFFRREMQTKIDPLNKKITDLMTKVYAVEKQIARVAIHDEVFKRLFEFYADLLDPEEFKRSGPNVTAFNDLKVVTSTGSPSSKPFSDFSMTYGFDNFYGKMDVNLDITKDFTIFAVVKIDFNVSSPLYLQFHIGKKSGFQTSYSFQRLNDHVFFFKQNSMERADFWN